MSGAAWRGVALRLRHACCHALGRADTRCVLGAAAGRTPTGAAWTSIDARGRATPSAARRELREELGCDVRELRPLGRVVNDSGQLAGIPHLFAARVTETGAADGEPGEAIGRVDRWHFTKLRAACERGDIVDSLTLAAVLRVAPHFEGDRFAWRDALAPRDPIR